MQKFNHYFSNVAQWCAIHSGRSYTFIIAVSIIIVWAITGPIFNFSDTWQLIINTGTTIITFLMVFLLQHTQNRDTAAMHAKLDELILVNKKASNLLLGLEGLSEQEIAQVTKYYKEIREKQ
jgi:low affinity Fe/Cu permease